MNPSIEILNIHNYIVIPFFQNRDILGCCSVTLARPTVITIFSKTFLIRFFINLALIFNRNKPILMNIV